jgi:hypothetical protein
MDTTIIYETLGIILAGLFKVMILEDYWRNLRRKINFIGEAGSKDVNKLQK